MRPSIGCSPAAAGIVVSALIACASTATASFVGFGVTSTTATVQGQQLYIYTLTAQFDGPADTVYRAFDLAAANSQWFNGFWHKDNGADDLSEATLSQSNGTWDPRRTGSSTLNRPYDSYLTIGGIASSANTTSDQNDSILAAQFMSAGWDRASLPNGSDFEWFNQQPSNAQGRVGLSPGVAANEVRLGQFVLSAGHEARTFSLSIGYNNGDYIDSDGENLLIATGTFTLGNALPAPGALALLALGAPFGARMRRR